MDFKGLADLMWIELGCLGLFLMGVGGLITSVLFGVAWLIIGK